MYQAATQIINGQEVRPNGTPLLDVINPATEEVLSSVSTAGPAEVAAALEAARQGMAEWRAKSAWERSTILRRVGVLMRERADAIGRLLTYEIGKPLAEGRGETMGSADYFEWCADEARRIYDVTLPGRSATSRFEIHHEPIGIVLALTAWNFPINLSARKIAMALAAGCSLILRPAEEGPASVAALIRCCHDAGVPVGAVNLLVGSPDAIVKPLMAEKDVRMVSFTGSTRVGKLLIQQSAETVKRLSLELGGHAPFLVLEDADIDTAVTVALGAKFRNAGQVCTSASRFFVHQSHVRAFTEGLVEGARKIKLGNGFEDGVQMGPLATNRQRERAERLVADARQKGASILTGGQRPQAMNRGYFFEPTVMTDVPENADILTQEPFTPIAAIVPFTNTDEIIQRANSLEAALAAYVVSRSGGASDAISARLQAGAIAVNTAAVATPEAPFGGLKESGYGKEGGPEGVRDFLIQRYVHRVAAQ
ncbi:MAG TPA: NAD-dependent succinate-semialdehyde dehydrogenase [Devosiaceae bacterium]|jgi:succinate-semialdehyde dehydrogenase/glutarate-semialdehyde dehydrogenase